MKKFKVIIICGMLAAVAGLIVVFYLTQPLSASDIFRNSIKTVVELKAFDDENNSAFGSAVCIDNSGTFITNAHILSFSSEGETKTFENIEIRFAASEEYLPAIITKIDYEKDLALIKSSVRAQAAVIREDTVYEGETVYAVGNSQNYGVSIMNGIVSQKQLKIVAEDRQITAIQCALSITEGNSGGALFDECGRLAGITTFRMKDNLGQIIYGTSFAIPIVTVREFLVSD